MSPSTEPAKAISESRERIARVVSEQPQGVRGVCLVEPRALTEEEQAYAKKLSRQARRALERHGRQTAA